MEATQFHLDIFGLREQPFAPTADPSYFYATREHKSCLFRLWSSIDGRHGIALVLGNYGTGKTTLLRKLMTGMAADPERYTTAVIGSPVPSWTSFALLEAITRQFRLRPEKRSFASYMDSLNQYLLEHRGKVCTLIIDDAQNLNKRGQLELLRLVQNLETPQHKLLNLVLFAQLEWTGVLQAAPNFEQRINMTYTLSPLQIEEAKQFIDYRLAQAGGGGPLAPKFADNAIEMMHAYSDGNPRMIVTLCRNALLFAAQIKTNRINQDIILHTIDKTTVPNAERRAKATAVMESLPPRQRPLAPPVVHQAPLAAVSEGAKPKSLDDRANDLLLRAVRAKQRQ